MVVSGDNDVEDAAVSARESERAAWRWWTVFTVCWSAGLGLVAVGVVVVTGVIVYDGCCRPSRRARPRPGTLMPLTAATRYGAAQSASSTSCQLIAGRTP